MTHNLNVVHRPGLKHKNADALSRSPGKAYSRQESASVNSDSEDEIPEKYNDCSTVRAITCSEDRLKYHKNQFVLCGWDIFNIRKLQLEDRSIGFMMTEFEQQHPIPDWNVISDKSTDLKTMWNMWDRFKICNGNLYVK